MIGNASPRGTDSAKVIQVIVTKSLCGRGSQDDVVRIVTQYWDFSGRLLAENDPEIEFKAMCGASSVALGEAE